MVEYEQGMTKVWSDGEKIVIHNRSGKKWVKDNVERIFGMGEWDKIHSVAYTEVNQIKTTHVKANYECVSGYIPQRVINDLASQPDPSDEVLPKEEEKRVKLEALRDI